MKDKEHHVYMVQAGKFIKIGWTSDINARVETIQTCNPLRIKVVALFPCKSEYHARAMELQLHRRYRRWRVFGEWFQKDAVLDGLCGEKERNELEELEQQELASAFEAMGRI